MYDINGDGALDEAEVKMRQMDRSNRVVYGLLKEQIDTQCQLFNTKRIVVGLSVFTVILALSNLGTAWAAAVLSKETAVDASGARMTIRKITAGTKTMAANNNLFYENEAENAMRGGDEPNAGDPTIDLGGDDGNNIVEAEGLPPSRLGVRGRFTISPEQARAIWVDCQSSTSSTITRPCAFSSELGACVCGACTSFSRTGGGDEDEETTLVIYTYGEAIRVTCPPRGGQSDGTATHRRTGAGDGGARCTLQSSAILLMHFLLGDKGGQ